MRNFGKLLPPPLRERRGIPFYYDKSEKEFTADVYERFDELVSRQVALHLADELHGGYPFQAVLDYLLRLLPEQPPRCVADVGCSVGRLIGELALKFPAADCYGLDYSYQMLRQACDYWCRAATLKPNVARYGFSTPQIRGRTTDNLHFALSRAEKLPFPDASLDLIFSTFLLDRLGDPFAGLAEMLRTLNSGGRLVAVTPLNFFRTEQWRKYHPPIKFYDYLMRLDCQILDWTDPLSLEEPLDVRGNAVRWQTVAFAIEKQ